MASSQFVVEIQGVDALVAKFQQAPEIAAPLLQRALSASQAILAKHTVKGVVPWRTGFLTQSFRAELTQGMLRWFPTAEYACVFSGKTIVTTDKGKKFIGTLKLGDKVLTQDGLFHPVTFVHSFPATEKPNLVKLKVEWRDDRTHDLILTEDHKVLTYRDGRNKWIPAGELLPTDMLFDRIKKPYNKGTAKTKICRNCNKNFTGKAQFYCSLPCRNKFWESNGNPNVGSNRSVVSRMAMSKAAERRFRLNPKDHPNYKLGELGHKTGIEAQAENWLRDIGVRYESQKLIGKYWVDFYVPEWNTIFECDGAFWHKNQNKDIERDKQILKHMPGVRIVHIHFYNERFSPKLTPKPIEDVSYVAVNPNINSYIDLDVFRPRRIISIHKWRYERKRGHRSAPLYDISVEGMHSFLANGILISNSHVEFGTKPHVILPKNKLALYWPGAQHPVKKVNHPGSKGQDYMGKIVQLSQDEINAEFGKALERITAALASS